MFPAYLVKARNSCFNTHTDTQYLLKNVTNAQTLRNRTRNQTEYNYVYVCAKKMSK